MEFTLDYETRSRCPLPRPKDRGPATVLDNPIKCGAWNYSRDPSTTVLCAAIDDDLLLDVEMIRRRIEAADVITAHNASFEKAVTLHVLGLDVPARKWRCTAARARHANIAGDLDGAGTMLGLGDDERKDADGHKVMLKLSSPNPNVGKKRVTQKALYQRITKKYLNEFPDCGYDYGERVLIRPEVSYIEPEWIDDTDLFARLHAYCLQDVVAERALGDHLPLLPDKEQRIWEFDRRANERGFPVDLEFCRGATQILAEAFAETQRAVSELTGGLITKGTQTARIQKFINERGINIGDLQAETVDEVLERPDLPHAVRDILHLRQSVSSAAISKYGCALDMSNEDGRLREGLMYYGASQTGRWTGPGFNPLNMKKGITLDERMIECAADGDLGMFVALYGEQAIDNLGGMIRGIIAAPPGRTFVDADSSQIELRIVHWLADDHAMLDMIRSGFDPYVAGYAKMYGVSPSSVTKEMRQKGKVLGLGMQYAMGVNRLMANEGWDAAKANQTIQTYRNANKEVCAMWDRLTSAAILAIRRGVRVRCGKLVFEVQGDWLTMLLPSGRRLYYYQPRIEENKHGFPCVSFLSRKGRKQIGGGHLLENAAQAICRDLLCDWMLEMEALNMEVLFNVYDSILVECDRDEASDLKGEVERIMTSAEDCYKGLPLGVGADIKRRFEK